MKYIMITALLIIQIAACATVYAYIENEEYYKNADYEEYIESSETYCTPKQTLKDKLKNVFIGQPTGFTPQIAPAPYSTSYGPSYMQGFYSGTRWNDHNSFNPTGITKLMGKSF